MTGPDIWREVRARQDAPYVYIILLTGLDQSDDLVQGMASGADDFISKPFDAAVLSARLRAGERILDLQRRLLEAQEALEIRATHDGLTGLLNRAAILERLSDEIVRSARESVSVGVILVDLDHFKLVNDNYGHSAGDCVLKETALRMTNMMRSYDSVARYGGEEFLIVAPHCDLTAARGLAERVRHAIGMTPVHSPKGALAVTASLGVATPGAIRDYHAGTLVNLADQALYRAKQRGRNRVECAAAEYKTQEMTH